MRLQMRKPMNGLSETESDGMAKENRRRPHLTFNMDIPAHRKAYEIFVSHGSSTEFIVECINRYEDSITRSELEEMLRGLNAVPVEQKETAEENQLPPEDLMDFDSW